MGKNQKLKLTFIATFISLSISYPTFSSIVRDDVDYQYFRDFAENKGSFTVGARDIPVYNKNKELIGYALGNIPMPDFSSADRNNAVAAAIHAQYIISVKHNRGYSTTQFGGQGNNPDAHHYAYLITGRNNYPEGLNNLNDDYHLPRLHKLITEIVPSEETEYGIDGATYLDKDRFPIFARVGSGTQAIRDKQNNRTGLVGAYNYLTGGVPLRVTGRRFAWFDTGGSVFDDYYGPLVTYSTPGDSGSSMWVFDKEKQKWLHHSVLNFYAGDHGHANTGSITRKEWNNTIINSNIINIDNKSTYPLVWNATNNTSTITNEDTPISIDLYSQDLKDKKTDTAGPERLDFNHGKTIRFTGNKGTLTLNNNINQGAGALYFETDFDVTGTDINTLWQGAGIYIDEGKTVNWKLHNPQNDRLSKIGKGTLHINGIGKNLGDISVGDGIVILDQQPDQTGHKQAFNQLGIVSGRPTVILNSPDQLDPNNIYFGFRGGRLDINGNNLSFKYIQNVDEGAKIVNHNTDKIANLTITNRSLTNIEDLNIGDRVSANQDLYRWHKKQSGKPYDYFLPRNNRQSNHPYYPTNQTSNEYWEYLGDDLDEAKKIALERKNQKLLYSAFNGYFGEDNNQYPNGRMNINYNPDSNKHLLLISGGININGDLSIHRGKLVLSGRPTPHAYDHLNHKEVVIENDWINRTFNAKNIVISNDATLDIGRNVSNVNSNFSLHQNASANLGFISGTTPECIRSDLSGVINCGIKTLSSDTLSSLPITTINGNITLSDQSILKLGRAILTGSIQGTDNSETILNADSYWKMTENSTVGNLQLTKGSKIKLSHTSNSDISNKYNVLNISQLSGNGFFEYFTNLNANQGDRIIVSNQATGEHKLYVTDSGQEPKTDKLTLLTVKNFSQNAINLNVSLANPNESVDLGTYRYQLRHKDDSYVLSIAHKNGSGVTEEKYRIPKLIHQNGDVIFNEDKPIVEFKNGKNVHTEDKPTIEFKNGKSVQAEDKPTVEFKNGKSVQAEDKPTVEFKNGKSVQTEDKPTIEFKNGKSVHVENKPNVEFKNGKSVQAEDKPYLNFEILNLVQQDNIGKIPNTQQSEIISRYSNTGLSELSSQTHTLVNVNSTINKEVINNNAQDLNVWTNIQRSTLFSSSVNYREYQQSGNLIQLGIEKSLHNDIMIGGILSNAKISNIFDDNIVGKARLTQFTLYTKKIWDNQIISNIDISYGKSHNEINYKNRVSFNRNIFSIGSILGKSWKFNDFDIKPSLGIRYYHISKTNYNFDGAKISISPLDFVTYQIGLNINKSFIFNKLIIKPEYNLNFVDTLYKNINFKINNNRLNQQIGRYIENELGITTQYGQWNIKIHGSLLNGNEIKKQHTVGLKLSYNW
ncbi:IgA-specific serine endopeptidase [Bisgaardia hudsonensis]|uniref:Immunoglobulin A1 protease autotransporter n=1 Tax=Bisgaardia hudsonensis TaxID=109472 RepID=A0A4R2MTX3_9PAST|nr:S6 family peptidase [Bisgaardia hudsonensis]QLB13670.1 hypothetical protein A6A11_08635 [Bisgaardia hudsonensis]TCP12004.1 IgA-specific serine endopeptidase [Bisgaardia hudsonensis]